MRVQTSANIFFDNGRYQVSAALLSTPRRFYPIANTTARIRRDPLWWSLSMIGFVVATTNIYGDLLYHHELVTLWSLAGVAGLLGFGTAILHIDAIGHPNAFIFANVWTIRKIYRALRSAHLYAQSAPNLPHTIGECG